MPRFPRGWRGLAHPQAARTSAAGLSYRPGWRGSGMTPIRTVPVASYTRVISGVPINGGQAQGVIAGSGGGSSGGAILDTSGGAILDTSGGAILDTSGGSSGSSTGSLTLQVGPSGLGNVWYVAQVTVQTTTGVLDTSTATIYLGPAATPTTVVATIFPGGAGTAAVAIPPITPGQTLICIWTNAHVGDVASFNVIGTQDARGTG